MLSLVGSGFQCIFIVSLLSPPLEKDIGSSSKTMFCYVAVIFFWNKFEFPLPNDTVCLVWLKVSYEELCYNTSMQINKLHACQLPH